MGRSKKPGVVRWTRLSPHIDGLLVGMAERDRRSVSELLGFAAEEYVNKRFGQTTPEAAAVPTETQ